MTKYKERIMIKLNLQYNFVHLAYQSCIKTRLFNIREKMSIQTFAYATRN